MVKATRANKSASMWYRAACVLLMLALALCPSFCACSSASAEGSGGGGSAPAQGGDSVPTGAEFDPPEEPAMPKVAADEWSPIDVSHVEDGYVSAAAESSSKLKFQVSSGDAAYNYDLPNDGTPTVFPVNLGDGAYLFRIMENTEGSNYAELEAVEADVQLSSELAPFLVPNQYCDYDDDSACVKKARELTANAQNEGEAVSAVCNYIIENVSYDGDKAQKLSTETGYIPNPDETLSTGKGVCFDYASLGAAMLRSVGLPTKIITGYVSPGDIYHAWIMVYIDGTWQTGEFNVNPNTWSRVDLTFASSGSSEFTGDGASYTDRYVY